MAAFARFGFVWDTRRWAGAVCTSFASVTWTDAHVALCVLQDSRKARLEKLMHHGAYVFIFAGCWMLVGIHRMDESLDNMTWLLRLDVFGMTAQVIWCSLF